MTFIQTDIVPFDDHHQPGVDRLMAMIEQEFPEPITAPKPDLEKDPAPVPGKYWVAMINKEVIGTIALSVVENNAAILKRFFLDKPYRGQGIAQALFRTAMKWISDNKINTIYLGTMTQFRAAQKFYEKEGFQQILSTELPADVRLNPVDDLFYRKKL